MTPRVADLGDMPAITAGFRPFRPAPTAAGPGDPPPGTPSGPWHPRHADEATYRAWLNSLDNDEFIAEIERGTADVHTTIARHRASLREVA